MKSFKLEEQCEEIDASIFSGDTLYDAEAFEKLELYVGRWQRALAAHEFMKEKDEIVKQFLTRWLEDINEIDMKTEFELQIQEALNDKLQELR